jgi:hypothetical protein
VGIGLDGSQAAQPGSEGWVASIELNRCNLSSANLFARHRHRNSPERSRVPWVFVSVACGGGCTVGPKSGARAGTDGAGARVVVFVGGRVGYLRAADPAALPALDAELPMRCSVGRALLLRCMALITSDNDRLSKPPSLGRG